MCSKPINSLYKGFSFKITINQGSNKEDKITNRNTNRHSKGISCFLICNVVWIRIVVRVVIAICIVVGICVIIGIDISREVIAIIWIVVVILIEACWWCIGAFASKCATAWDAIQSVELTEIMCISSIIVICVVWIVVVFVLAFISK